MRRAWLGACLALGLACDGGGGLGGGDDEPELPSPYADDGADTDAPVPSMDPDAIVNASVAGLRTFVDLQPDAVVDAWESMLVLEAGCPEEQQSTMEGESTVITWATEGCTTSTGLEIRGAGRLERFAGADGARTTEGAALFSEGGTTRLAAADGSFIELNGYVYYERGTSAEGADGYFEVNGTLAADEATAAASPVLDPAVRAQGFLFSYSGAGYQALGGGGSVSGPVLGDVLAFQFSNFLVVPQACATEPVATLSVRDGEGFWHDVVFDAATLVDDEEPQFEPEQCDGCGTYLAAGAVVGDACISAAQVASLVDWEGHPW